MIAVVTVIVVIAVAVIVIIVVVVILIVIVVVVAIVVVVTVTYRNIRAGIGMVCPGHHSNIIPVLKRRSQQLIIGVLVIVDD